MRELLPATKDVKPRLAALARLERASTLDAPTRLRLEGRCLLQRYGFDDGRGPAPVPSSAPSRSVAVWR
jgi:hypothetical protein